MATLIDEKGLQHYADKMVKAENRKVGTKSLPTALTEIDAMIDSMKGKFEQAYGDALEENFENQENTFKIGTGVGEDRAETVEDGFISIDKLEGKTLVNRLKGENKTVQLPHRIELDEMIIKSNTDYTFQSTNGNAIASFKQPKYKEVICQDGIKLENNLDTSNKIEFRSIEGQTLKNITGISFKDKKEFEYFSPYATLESGYIKIDKIDNAVIGTKPFNIDKNKEYTLILDVEISKDFSSDTMDRPRFLLNDRTDEKTFTTKIVYSYNELKALKSPVKIKLTNNMNDSAIKKGIGGYFYEVKTGYIKFRYMILEGDYTQKDVPDFIEGVQGVGRKSKNLVNCEMLENRYITKEGVLSSAPGWYATGDFVEIEPNTNYVQSITTFNSVACCAFYDSNKSFISAVPNATKYKTPINAKYLKTCYRTNSAKEGLFQIEKGMVATPYEPYFEGYKIGVKTHGKNLFNKKYVRGNYNTSSKEFVISPTNIHLLTATPITSEKGFTITSTLPKGISGYNGDNGQTYLIKFEKNTNKFISHEHIRGKKYIERNTEGYYYLLQANSISDEQIKEWTNSIQIEEGITATPYESYKESTSEIILQEQLQGVEGVKDRLYFDNGYKVEKRFGVQHITSEYLKNSGTNLGTDGRQEYLYFNPIGRVLPNALNNSSAVGLCDKLPVFRTYSNPPSFGIRLTNTFDFLFPVPNSLTWEEKRDFVYRELDKMGGITVIYELATPTVVNTQTKEQIKLDTHQPTYFTVDSGVAPSKTAIDVPVLEQITGKSGTLRTPATLDRVYLDIQGSGEIQDMMLFEGAGETKTYFSDLKSTGENSLVIKSCGKNIQDEKAYIELCKKYAPRDVIEDLYNGTSVYRLKCYAGLWKKPVATQSFKKNTQYTISFTGHYMDEKNQKQVPQSGLLVSYTDGTSDNIPINTEFKNVVFTTRPNKTLLKVKPGYFAGQWLVIKKGTFQIEEGTRATSYEPYKEVSKTITLKEPLRSLPSGVKDTIEKIDGEWKIIRRCGQRTFTPEDSWVYSPGFSKLGSQCGYIMPSFPRGSDEYNSCISTHFITGAPGTMERKGGIWLNGDKSFWVGIPNHMLKTPDKDGYLKWLRENRLTIVYQLKEPVIETISPLTLQAWKNGSLLIEDPINVASAHTVALNKPGQILKNIEELTILRDRVEKLEANYDQLALEQAHQLALTKQSIELDYEI